LGFLKGLLKFLFALLSILATLFIIVCGIIYATNPERYKTIVVQQFEKETGQKIELHGPVEINFLPLPHANLNKAVLRLKVGTEEIVIAADYIGFALTWRSLISDVKKIQSIDAKNVFITVYQQNKIKQKIKVDSFEGELINAYLRMSFPKFKIKLGENAFAGNMSVSFEDKITKITTSMKADLWDVSKISEAFEKNQDDTLSEVMRSDWIKQTNAEISIQAKNIKSPKLAVSNANIKLKLKNSVLNGLVRGKISLGELSSNFMIEGTKKSAPEIAATFKIKDPAQKNNMEGNFKYTFLEKKARVFGKLKTQTWTVDFMPKVPHPEGRVFSSAPFDIQWPKDIIAKFDFQTDRLVFEDFILMQANLAINFEDHQLEISPQGKLAQGNLTGKLHIQNKEQGEVEAKGHLALQNANAAEFLKIIDKDLQVQGGTISGEFKGNSKGKNVAELMAHLSGKSLVQIQQMTLLNKAIDARYVDVFAAMLKALKPTNKETVLECIAWRFNIQDGIAVAKESIGIETRDLYVLGSGKLDLRTEGLNFIFDISPRSQMNLEVGAMDNVAFLKGSLAAPQVETSARGLIQEGSTLMLGFATGGVSLLAEKLFKVVTQLCSQCRHVLGQLFA